MAPLNPAAQPFIPRQFATSHAQRVVHSIANCPSIDTASDSNRLTELPEELITSILGHLHEPRDAAASALTCQCMHVAAGMAPLRLKLEPRGELGIADEAMRLSRCLQGLPRSFPGLAELDLSGCMVENTEVQSMATSLPSLRILHLSACRKLSPLLLLELFPTGRPEQSAAAVPAPACSLQAVDLQRCWLLHLGCLSHLLAHARIPGAGLRTVLLSHLDLSDWAPPAGCLAGAAPAPGQAPTRGTATPHPSTEFEGITQPSCSITGRNDRTGLGGKVMAAGAGVLLGCSNRAGGAGAGAEVAAAAAADVQPAGGTEGHGSALAANTAISLQPGSGSQDEGGGVEIRRGVMPGTSLQLRGGRRGALLEPAAGSGLRILALSNCARLGRSGLQAMAAGCPCLEHLFLGGTTIVTQQAQGHSTSGPAAPEPPAGSGAGESAGSPKASQVSALRSMVEAIRGLAPADGRGIHAQVSEELASLVSALPRLQTLELTFASASILAALWASPPVQARPGFCIWDFCSLQCLREAGQLLRGCERGDASAPAQQLHPELAMAVSAAVNCSSRARHTPLHLAALEGSLHEAKELLRLGAALDPPDRMGSTPLFLACEQGHAATAALLLRAGADPAAQNRAEERPLYIASLRGHAAVVSELLTALLSRHLPWQGPECYSKGWAPLLAAALSDRLQVARTLLNAAGGPSQRAIMVAATNVFGQGPLHTAARRGNLPMLQLLLEYGVPAALLARDKKGETPIGLAKKSGHLQLATWLEAQAFGGHAMPPDTPQHLAKQQMRHHRGLQRCRQESLQASQHRRHAVQLCRNSIKS